MTMHISGSNVSKARDVSEAEARESLAQEYDRRAERAALAAISHPRLAGYWHCLEDAWVARAADIRKGASND